MRCSPAVNGSAALDHLAFQIGRIDFELPHQFAVDEERRVRGLGLIGAVSVQGEAETRIRHPPGTGA